MTTTISPKQQHLAACAASKSAAAARKAQRISAHLRANESSRHEAAVRRILARSGRPSVASMLASAFALVCDKKDWRHGVDAIVDGRMSNADYDMTVAAIAFFGCSDKVGTIRDDDRVQFVADGFFANVCHDTSCVPHEQALRVELTATAGSLPQQPTWTLLTALAA